MISRCGQQEAKQQNNESDKHNTTVAFDRDQETQQVSKQNHDGL